VRNTEASDARTLGGRFGRYEILTRLALGGMAEVWLAQVTSVGGFQKKVVLKLMLPHLAESQEFVRLFVQEASLAARLDHPNIVQIFDLGEMEGRYFIAMEYVPGRSLRQIRRRMRERNESVPVWFLLRAVANACEGLHYAHDLADDQGHSLGLVHRDVSPENIMVSFTGTSKLLDFGVATATTTTVLSDRLVGKYQYIAPERVHGDRSDRRSDVYSVGVVLYEYLTGTRPFEGPDDIAVLRKVIEGRPRDPREVSPAIPADLARIVRTAMAADPNRRYQDAEALAADIVAYLDAHHPNKGDRSMAVVLGSL
jgi:serine/threonine-protein kinase